MNKKLEAKKIEAEHGELSIDEIVSLAQVCNDTGDYENCIALYQSIPEEKRDFFVTLDLGNVYYRANKLIEAEEQFQRLTELKPSHIEGWNNLGIVLMALNTIEEAQKAFVAVLSIEPNNYGSLLNLATCYQKLEEYTLAEETFQRAISLRRYSADGWYNLGNLYLLLKRYKEAWEMYRKALSINRFDTSALKNGAIALEDLGEHEEALKLLEQLFELVTPDASLLLLKGTLLVQARRLEEAKKVYLTIITDAPERKEAWLALQDIVLQLGDIDTYLKTVTTLMEDSNIVQIAEAVALLVDMDRPDVAMSLVDEATVRGKGGIPLEAERMVILAHSDDGADLLSAEKIFSIVKNHAEESERIAYTCALYAYTRKRYHDLLQFLQPLSQERYLLLYCEAYLGLQDPAKALEVLGDLDKIKDGDLLFCATRAEVLLHNPTYAKELLLRAMEQGFSDIDKISEEPDVQKLLPQFSHLS